MSCSAACSRVNATAPAFLRVEESILSLIHVSASDVVAPNVFAKRCTAGGLSLPYQAPLPSGLGSSEKVSGAFLLGIGFLASSENLSAAISTGICNVE